MATKISTPSHIISILFHLYCNYQYPDIKYSLLILTRKLGDESGATFHLVHFLICKGETHENTLNSVSFMFFYESYFDCLFTVTDIGVYNINNN